MPNIESWYRWPPAIFILYFPVCQIFAKMNRFRWCLVISTYFTLTLNIWYSAVKSNIRTQNLSSCMSHLTYCMSNKKRWWPHTNGWKKPENWPGFLALQKSHWFCCFPQILSFGPLKHLLAKNKCVPKCQVWSWVTVMTATVSVSKKLGWFGYGLMDQCLFYVCVCVLGRGPISLTFYPGYLNLPNWLWNSWFFPLSGRFFLLNFPIKSKNTAVGQWVSKLLTDDIRLSNQWSKSSKKKRFFVWQHFWHLKNYSGCQWFSEKTSSNKFPSDALRKLIRPDQMMYALSLSKDLHRHGKVC